MKAGGAQGDCDDWGQVATYLDHEDVRWLEGLAHRRGISVADAVLLTTREAERDSVWEMERAL